MTNRVEHTRSNWQNCSISLTLQPTNSFRISILKCIFLGIKGTRDGFTTNILFLHLAMKLFWCYKGTNVLNDIPGLRRFRPLSRVVHEIIGLPKLYCFLYSPVTKGVHSANNHRTLRRLGFVFFFSQELSRARWIGFFNNELWCRKLLHRYPQGVTPLTSCPLSAPHKVTCPVACQPNR